jgi:hypothetical protein
MGVRKQVLVEVGSADWLAGRPASHVGLVWKSYKQH